MGSIRVREIDIIRTFSEILEEKFDVPILDVVEDYPRPCFMTELISLNSERFMTEHVDSYLSMKLYYFPSTEENNAAEISLMKDELIDLFYLDLNSLIPTKVPLEIIEVSFDEIRDVLRVSVDFNLSQRIMLGKGDVMTELELQSTVNGSKLEPENM